MRRLSTRPSPETVTATTFLSATRVKWTERRTTRAEPGAATTATSPVSSVRTREVAWRNLSSSNGSDPSPLVIFAFSASPGGRAVMSSRT